MMKINSNGLIVWISSRARITDCVVSTLQKIILAESGCERCICLRTAARCQSVIFASFYKTTESVAWHTLRSSLALVSVRSLAPLTEDAIDETCPFRSQIGDACEYFMHIGRHRTAVSLAPCLMDERSSSQCTRLMSAEESTPTEIDKCVSE